jgi:spore germination protein GerM
MNRPIVIGVVLFLITVGVLAYLLKHRPAPAARTSQTTAPAQSPKPEEPQNQRKINVKLYFANDDSTQLIPEERSIVYHDGLSAQANEILQELIKGPEGDLAATIPTDTKLLDIFMSKDGVAYVDFSQELSSGTPGGSLAEMSTVFSIVDTLTLNFPQIKGVQILVNDQAVDTLNGHVDLSRPLHQDLSMVRHEPSQPQTEPQTQTQPS